MVNTETEENGTIQSGNPAKRIKMQELWLDRLPTNICSRIILFLPPPLVPEDVGSQLTELEQTPATLLLAEASSKQRFAVCVALAYELHVHLVSCLKHERHLVCRWKAVLGDEVRVVSLPFHIGSHPEITGLLALPSLSQAIIPNHPSYIRAMISGSSIREISLDLIHYLPIKSTNPLDLLPDLLDACPVKKVRLACHGCPSDVSSPCEAVERLRHVKGQSSSVQSLETLHLKCEGSHVRHLHHAMGLFENIQELTLEREYLEVKRNRSVDGDRRHWIWGPEFERAARRLQSVRILHVRGAYELSKRIGPSVTSLAINHVFTAEDVAQLRNFPNLTVLDIWLKRGAEASFPRDLCSLHTLYLRWYLGDGQAEVTAGNEEDGSESRSEHSGCLVSYHTGWWWEDYHTSVPVFLFELVQRNCQLEVLRLRHVRILRCEQEAVLRTLSGTLRELEMPLYRHGVPAAEQLTWLMGMMGKYNHGLVQFHCDEATEDVKVCGCKETRIIRDMELGWEVLQRRVPKLRGIGILVQSLAEKPDLPHLDPRPRCEQCDDLVGGAQNEP